MRCYVGIKMTKQERYDLARKESRRVRGIMHQVPLDLRTKEEWIEELEKEILTPQKNNFCTLAL